MIVVYIALISVCAFFIAVAHVSTRPFSFYLGSQRYGPLITAASIVAAFTGGSAIINTTGLAAKFGHWAFFDVFPAVVGLLLSAILVRIRFFGKSFSQGFFSVDGALYDRRAVTIHYAQIALLYTLVVSAQLRAVATLATQIGIPVWLAVALSCITVAVYSYRGFDAVTRTDLAQLCCMVPMYIILAFIAFETISPETIPETTAPQAQMPLSLAIALCLPVVFLPISQEIHQRGAAAVTEKAVGASYLLAAILYLGFGSLLVIAFAHTPTLRSYGYSERHESYRCGTCSDRYLLRQSCPPSTRSTNIASHAVEQLPFMHRFSSATIQSTLLVIGSIVFLFFPTVLSLILFALFVYMAGPALSFIAVYSGIHPKQSAIIGATFVGLQMVTQFKPAVFTDLPHMPTIVRNMDSVQIGLLLLISQLGVLCIVRLYHRLS